MGHKIIEAADYRYYLTNSRAEEMMHLKWVSCSWSLIEEFCRTMGVQRSDFWVVGASSFEPLDQLGDRQSYSGCENI